MDPQKADDCQGDELSLVDLLIVLVRRRRLIVSSAAILALGAILAYLVLPTIVYGRAMDKRVYEVRGVAGVHEAVTLAVGSERAHQQLRLWVNDPRLILESLQAAGFERLDDETPLGTGEAALTAVRRRIVENKGRDGTALPGKRQVYSCSCEANRITLTFKDKDSAKAQRFINNMMDRVTKELAAFVEPYALSSVEAYEKLLTIREPSEVVAMNVVQQYHSYSLIKAFLDKDTQPLALDPALQVYVPEDSLALVKAKVAKTGILAVFGGFFLAILLAFVLQYVDSVRQDPEAMAKFRAAMKRK